MTLDRMSAGLETPFKIMNNCGDFVYFPEYWTERSSGAIPRSKQTTDVVDQFWLVTGRG